MKNDSARDKAVDKLVAGKLSARLQDEGRDCPDAETLAAYVERTLSNLERQTWETHLAACRFCQEQVAELVRMGEEDELTEVERIAPATRKVAGFRWAWAAPALVALVVAGLWYTGEFRHLLRQQEPATAEAPAPPTPSSTDSLRDKNVQPTSPARRELAEAVPAEQEAAKPSSNLKSAPKISVYGSPGSRVEGAPGLAGGAGYGVSAEKDEAASTTSAERGRLGESGAPAAVSDDLSRVANEEYRAVTGGLPSGAPAAPPAAAGQRAEAKSPSQDVELSKEVARADVQGKKTASAAARGELVQPLAVPSDSGVEFHGFIRDRRTWRVGRGGLIQKAAPNGAWETRPSGVKSDLFDISFATPAVGWAVGQAGTVLGTKDGGTTWTKLPSPTTEDLVRVGAINETKVNVITRSGKTLQSSDGGRSWKTLGQD